ncbi:hypothetical protein [Photorhabdus antumapuensis]|uniref:hypothetical protein n=1 Tax=Photorhabdus antumapuensis TaxID=2862867 RepID=UPI001CED7048|nr:hypothetical protein [Photorhabdus antumapuensis]
MATAGRIALEGCKANPALCLNNVGIFVADAVAPEAAVGTGVLATGAVKVLGNSKEGAKNLAEELNHASKPLLSNAKPDTHAVASLIENTRNQPANIRVNEISELFEYNHPRMGIQIGDRTLMEMPNKGNAKIFSGASEAEVKQYFMELTGSKNLPAGRSIPGKGNIYTVKTPKGTFNLRDFSISSSETGSVWTIDIPRGIGKPNAPVEIKFLK